VLTKKSNTTQRFSRYFFNTSWLFGEKIYRMVLAFFITVWMARYFGPEQFGIFSYALSFVTLFSVFASLGLDKLIVRELLAEPEAEKEILGSTFLLRLIGSLLLIGASASAVTMIRPEDWLTRVLVITFSVGYLFKSFQVIKFWFEAHVKGKFSSLVEAASITGSVGIKAILIIIEAPLIYFAGAVVLESFIAALGFCTIYKMQGNALLSWRPRVRRVKKMLVEAWPLILAGTLYTVYTKIDQVMLGEMIGYEAVGTYAAAVKISEGWFFIPAVIATSFFPAMLNAKKKSVVLYLGRTQHLFNLMAVIGVAAAVVITVIARPIIMLAFGADYEGAIWVLTIHIWGGIFLAMSGISYRYFIAEGLQRYSFYRGVTGLVINVTLNFLLIPLYGVIGAAISLVLSQSAALYIFNATSKKTRPIFFMQTRALFLVGAYSTIKEMRSLK
jgi:O-antigen/teichoic acid export membrane protein